MASADDLIRVYERRLADFEARLAAIERERERRPMRPRRTRPSPRRRRLPARRRCRRHVHRSAAARREAVAALHRESPFDAERFLDRRAQRHREDLPRGGHRSDRDRRRDARHDRRDEHGADQGGRAVGLVTTKGFRDVLQIARSYVPGGLGGWVIYNKPPPLAPLELTIEATERIGADGSVLIPLDEAALRRDLAELARKGIEALTVSLFNAYVDGRHERRIAEIAREVMPAIPVSISSDVIPEMYEYERAETTVVNSYIRPVVSKYVRNLERELSDKMRGDASCTSCVRTAASRRRARRWTVRSIC